VSPQLTRCLNRWQGFTLDMIQAALSTISCGLFVLATYLPEEQQLEPPLWLALTELVITTYFAFDYALQLFLAQVWLLALGLCIFVHPRSQTTRCTVCAVGDCVFVAVLCGHGGRMHSASSFPSLASLTW